MIKSLQIQKTFNDKTTYHINPTGKFVIGGPHGDTGLTGRKIIVDTYGGKEPMVEELLVEKILVKLTDLQPMLRDILPKNLVAAGVSKEILVQLSYAIGVVNPTSININTFNTAKVPIKRCDYCRKG